jgi:hypothetical protein
MNEAESDQDVPSRWQDYEEGPRSPIIFTLKRNKKRKRRYSRGLRDLQQMERRLTRSARRMSRSADKGMASYWKRREKSARKKRDGALRDFIPNSGWAMSRAMREASPLPYDLARAMSTRGTRRWLNRQVRMASRQWRAWRRS